MKSQPLNPKKLKIVLIEWIDAQSFNPQLPLIPVEELKDETPITTKSVGFLVAKNKECYVIADEYWEETDEVKWVHIIPKCCLKRIEVMRL